MYYIEKAKRIIIPKEMKFIDYCILVTRIEFDDIKRETGSSYFQVNKFY